MRIEVVGDDSISHQARTYAEYRLFAALSQHADTRHVRLASLMLRRAKSTRQCDGIVCAITVHLHSGQAARVRAYGTHPYAAINRAVERLRLNAFPLRGNSSAPEIVGSPTAVSD